MTLKLQNELDAANLNLTAARKVRDDAWQRYQTANLNVFAIERMCSEIFRKLIRHANGEFTKEAKE